MQLFIMNVQEDNILFNMKDKSIISGVTLVMCTTTVQARDLNILFRNWRTDIGL